MSASRFAESLAKHRHPNLADLTIMRTTLAQMVDRNGIADTIKLSAQRPFGRTRNPNSSYEFTLPADADSFLAGIVGVDRPGEGPLRVDLGWRFRRRLFLPPAQDTAANPTRQHAARFGAIHSCLPPAIRCQAGASGEARSRAHVTSDSAAPLRWPRELEPPASPFTLLGPRRPLAITNQTRSRASASRTLSALAVGGRQENHLGIKGLH